jgi:hypothetical protein
MANEQTTPQPFDRVNVPPSSIKKCTWSVTVGKNESAGHDHTVSTTKREWTRRSATAPTAATASDRRDIDRQRQHDRAEHEHEQRGVDHRGALR